ncbi:hypothetical protein BX666DRAFT_409478 [Dichotomocladium elegans]|nr:hypothetical protein BX666DRAFT_409478 [Dichotomocladium elegans]
MENSGKRRRTKDIIDLGRRGSRITRACDLCKKKKIRCHFSPGPSCSNCVSYEVECVFSEENRKRGPPKGYAEKLEWRIEQVGKAIRALTGKADIDALLQEHFGSLAIIRRRTGCIACSTVPGRCTL